jgi:hypothetical protein
MRYHVQRITTGEWLSRDFDLSAGVTTRALSAPGGVAGGVAPELRYYRHTDGLRFLEKWATAIYAEDDGQIRGGGIVADVNYDGGPVTVDAPGFAHYPTGLPYARATNFGRVDPLVVVRHLWDHVQSYSNGNIGMVVDQTTSNQFLGDNADPYGLLWWDTPDCGGEIDNLARSTPFDYTEQHAWANSSRSAVTHRLRLGYPRLGRRRTDLRFVEGENVTDHIPVDDTGDDHANDLVGIGKGEGAAMIHANIAVIDGRLRRAKVITDKTADKLRIDSILATTLRQVSDVQDIGEIKIIDHPNARIAAIDPGDDIPVDLDQPSFGRKRIWLRVLAVAEDDDGFTATLTTQRSTVFTYSGTQGST